MSAYFRSLLGYVEQLAQAISVQQQWLFPFELIYVLTA